MIEITTGVGEDVPGVVSVHESAFPGFFLTRLGPAFLRRFYGAIVEDEDGICVVARDDREIVGFAVGPVNPQSFFRRLFAKQALGFALDAVPALIRRPAMALSLLRGITYRGETPPRLERPALLSSLAVRARCVGRGVGSHLVAAFCSEAGRRGRQCVYLTTDRDGNETVNRFYAREGFEIVAELVRGDGRVLNVYARAASSDRADTAAREGFR